MNNRQQYLDSVSGILIIYMILYHCMQWSNTYDSLTSEMRWLSFFMPWFFFKSGMFYRHKSFVERARTGYKRLLRPYIFFSVLGFVVFFLCAFIRETSIKQILKDSIHSQVMAGATIGNLALWFLLSLFCVQLIFQYFIRLISKEFLARNKMLCHIIGAGGGITLCITTVYMAQYCIQRDIKYPLWCINIPIGLAFYLFGVLLRNTKISRITLFITTCCYILLMYYIPTNIDLRTGILREGQPWLYPFVSILGILSINGIAGKWLNRESALASIGEHSMFYYCMHWIILEVTSFFFYLTQPNDKWLCLAILILTQIIFLPFVRTLLQKTRFKDFSL